jgi:hypothetical protein
MEIALWIAQGAVALMFMGAGLAKLAKPRTELMASNERMAFMEDFSDGTIRFIGVAEVAGALGLVLPGITGIAPVLVPIAAVSLGVLFLLAGVVHLRRSEPQMVLDKVIVIALTAFIAWGRFGDRAF